MLVQTRHVVWRGRHSSRHTFFLIALGHFFSGYWKAAVSQGAQNSKWDLPLNRVCGVDTEVQALPGFQRSPTSIGSYLRVPEVISASWHQMDCCLANGGGGWMFGYNPSTLSPEPRVWSVCWKHKVHPRISREIKAMSFLSPWKTISKEQKGQKVDADTLWLCQRISQKAEWGAGES